MVLSDLHQQQRGSWILSPALLGFCAGAITSACLLWWYNDNDDRDCDGDNDDDDNRKDGGSSVDVPMMLYVDGSIKSLRSIMSIDNIASRFPELPSLPRRTPWPWLNRRRDRRQNNRQLKVTFSELELPDGDNNETDDSSSLLSSQTPPPTEEDQKSDLCIGSIFGLDVGGTLAKLVYFEQNPELALSEHVPHREKVYRTAASASTVLLARRGWHVDDNDIFLNEQFRSKRRSSSNIYPDGAQYDGDEQQEQQQQQGDGGGGGGADGVQKQQDGGGERRTSVGRSASPNKLHTAASDDDLRSLYDKRQESVPDDLRAYAKTVHLSERGLKESSALVAEEGAPSTTETKPPLVAANGTADNDEGGIAEETCNDYVCCLQEDTGASSGGGIIQRSRSMFDLSRSHAEAMDRFYSFARRLDSYREGIKDDALSFYSRSLGGHFHFIHFESRRMEFAMDLIRSNRLHLNIRAIGATGGGAHKFSAQFSDELGIEMRKQDELESLITGMQFILNTVVGECYTFRPHSNSKGPTPDTSRSGSANSSVHSTSWQEPGGGLPLDDDDDDYRMGDFDEKATSASSSNGGGTAGLDEWWWSCKVKRDSVCEAFTYPYLVVSIGTGVSILKVSGAGAYERISGSTIGGGTYWGLIRLLTDVEKFEDAMRLAEQGDPSKVDMMVGDIYGKNSGALEKLGLPADLVASSFGKLVAKEDPAAGLKQEDLARALLLMITINIGQVAYLNAKLSSISRIYFVGNFLRCNKISQRRLAFAIDYWSKGEMEALFLEHEGYFGALGAFLLNQGLDHDSVIDAPHHHHLRAQHSMPEDLHEAKSHHRSVSMPQAHSATRVNDTPFASAKKSSPKTLRDLLSFQSVV